MKKSLVGAVLGMLFLAACSSTPTTEKAHNDADVAFAAAMVPHHEQALEMARLVPSRSSDDQVRRLAERVEKAQAPEIAQLTGWLEEWGVRSGGHEGHDMAGMMSAEDMAKLEGLSGAEFDRTWLDMMIEHHEGAVEMARTELKDGRDAGAKKLAQAVVDGQTQEITEMKDLLKAG